MNAIHLLKVEFLFYVFLFSLPFPSFCSFHFSLLYLFTLIYMVLSLFFGVLFFIFFHFLCSFLFLFNSYFSIFAFIWIQF